MHSIFHTNYVFRERTFECVALNDLHAQDYTVQRVLVVVLCHRELNTYTVNSDYIVTRKPRPDLRACAQFIHMSSHMFAAFIRISFATFCVVN